MRRRRPSVLQPGQLALGLWNPAAVQTAAIAQAERREPVALAYGGRPPAVRGSETSEAAAASVAGNTRTMRARVMALFRARGGAGATDDELEAALGLRHQTASARRRELELMGRVEATEARRPTRSGRSARVYVAVGAGTGKGAA